MEWILLLLLFVENAAVTRKVHFFNVNWPFESKMNPEIMVLYLRIISNIIQSDHILSAQKNIYVDGQKGANY